MDLVGGAIRKIAYPLMETFKGNKIRENLSNLKQTQHLSIEELQKLQNLKLKKLLLYSIENVHAYKKYTDLLELIDRDPYEAIKKIHILNKKDFSKTSDNYLSDSIIKEDLILNRTGGSTGEPVRFYMDRETVEWYEAARWRGLSWWNIKIGDPSIMIWGSPVELSKKKDFYYRLKERYLKNRIIISAYDLKPDSIKDYVKMINKFKPNYIYGYASSLYFFSELILKNNLAVNAKLKGVVSTAETLYEYQREIIEKAFSTKTINEYGARDGGILAYQCTKGHMHITMENAFLEIVDIKTKLPVETNESGMLLVTDLNNYAMPRLRYNLGDVASISKERCECGINLPILKSIEGREDDTFVSIDGRYVHGHIVSHIIRNLNGISQFQLVQHDRNRFTLKLVKEEGYNKSLEPFIKNELKKVFGEVDISIDFLDSIPPANSGKIRYSIREFPL